MKSYRAFLWNHARCKGVHLYNQRRLIKSRAFSGDTTPNELRGTRLPKLVDLLDQYRSLVALGKITFDDEQVRVVMQLRRLQKELIDYVPPTVTSHYFQSDNVITEEEHKVWWLHSPQEREIAEDTKALTRILGHAEELANLTTPKGLLVTGPPGSGKTFLTDLWFSSIPTPYKARKHYGQLVLEIYRGVWEETQRRMTESYHDEVATHAGTPWNKSIRDRWRELLRTGSLPKVWTRRPGHSLFKNSLQPPIALVIAKRLLLRHWLLVFDEIQLLDVSSANLLADVLSWYWRLGGIVVGTSNKVPDDLYRNGVQRERLEPFVEALKVRCPVLTMRSEQDWREVKASVGAEKSWFIWGRENEFEKMVSSLAAQGEATKSETLYVFGRPLSIPWSRRGVCKLSFAELCETDLGPADYLTIASTYCTVAITCIPVLKLSTKNQARRFISLIDALYEARCRIVCLAEAEPEHLFFPDALSEAERRRGLDEIDPLMAESVAETRDVYRPNVSAYDSPTMSEAPEAPSSPLALDKLSIFSGQDEQFAFKRALSRLMEMTSSTYRLEEQWIPLQTSARKWEGASPSGASDRAVRAAPEHLPEASAHPSSDFVGEAAYANRDVASMKDRPEAPKLKEDHIWGMRDDWGD